MRARLKQTYKFPGAILFSGYSFNKTEWTTIPPHLEGIAPTLASDILEFEGKVELDPPKEVEQPSTPEEMPVDPVEELPLDLSDEELPQDAPVKPQKKRHKRGPD